MHRDFENLLDQLWVCYVDSFDDMFSSKCLCVSLKYDNHEKASELEHQYQK